MQFVNQFKNQLIHKLSIALLTPVSATAILCTFHGSFKVKIPMSVDKMHTQCVTMATYITLLQARIAADQNIHFQGVYC